MRGPEVRNFERRLKELFDQIDAELEERWGSDYTLHPARPPRGGSGNPESDGLFNVGASFSAGYGTEYGKGYVIETRMVTLEQVPRDVRTEIDAYTARRIEELLPEYFPDRELEVVQDGRVFKITGDLSL